MRSASSLTRARELQEQINKLKAELDPLREQLLQHLITKDLDHIESGDYRALRKVRHNWDYSPHTQREMLALRNTQKYEQREGLATDNPTIYLQLGSTKK